MWQWILKARVIIGRLTDILLAGREAGLWQKKDEPYRKVPSDPDPKENKKYEF